MKKKSSQKNFKLLSLLLVGVAVIAIAVINYGVMHSNPAPKNIKIDGTFLTTPTTINDFKLTDNKNKPFTKDNLKGHWTMLFFGFTNCGMVCPTSLAELNKMYQTLQKELPENQMPQVVMVSVDPERDTVERLNGYVTTFNPHFMGAVGSIDETEALKKQLHIVSGKMQVGTAKNQYTINHSAEILIFNPDAKLQAYFSYPHQAAQMVNDYQLILKAT
jgi:protein SCO1/2